MTTGMVTPSPAVTKVGSLVVIFIVALLAVWAINNNATLARWVAKKNGATAA